MQGFKSFACRVRHDSGVWAVVSESFGRRNRGIATVLALLGNSREIKQALSSLINYKGHRSVWIAITNAIGTPLRRDERLSKSSLILGMSRSTASRSRYMYARRVCLPKSHACMQNRAVLRIVFPCQPPTGTSNIQASGPLWLQAMCQSEQHVLPCMKFCIVENGTQSIEFPAC